MRAHGGHDFEGRRAGGRRGRAAGTGEFGGLQDQFALRDINKKGPADRAGPFVLVSLAVRSSIRFPMAPHVDRRS